MRVPSHLTIVPFTSGPPPWRQAEAKAKPAQPAVQPMPQALPAKQAEAKGFSFGDFIDAINPLQHIPIISTLYRKLTGDEIGAGAQLAGDALYGGLFGSLVTSLVSSVANLFVRETTGRDIGDHLLAAAGNTAPQDAATAAAPVQQAKPAAPYSFQASGQASELPAEYRMANQAYAAMCRPEARESGANHYWV